MMQLQRWMLVVCGVLAGVQSPLVINDGAPLPRQEPVREAFRTQVDDSRETHGEKSELLRRKIDQLLRSELTGHWYPGAVDRRRGGFHQTLARDWSVRPDENVFLVYQAR